MWVALLGIGMAERDQMDKRVATRSARAFVLATAGAVLASALAAAPGLAVEPSGPTDCPDILPVDQITGGMEATGWTATGNSAGTETVESFPVEILDVLHDGIAPGRDLIVIKARGPLFRDRGIWAGMSGSPVYHDGDLVGAVAYGFSYGASRIGGVTPAEDMAEIPQTAASTETASEVELSRAERRRIARAAGTSTASVDNEFVQLKMPLGVAGLSPRAARKFKQVVRREELPFIAHVAGKQAMGVGEVPGLPTTDDAPNPGESFAGALSLGDITFAGIGTTTMVCDDRALAFGHPFFWTGDTNLAAATARAITIVSDPNWGSYKLANIGAAFGTVDQDRLAGISAIVGDIPRVVPIESTITDLDTPAHEPRTGRTFAVDHEYLPYIVFLHNLSTSDVVVDEIGPGSSFTGWTLSGTREDGSPWSITRTNRWASRWDITYESIYEIERALYKILGQNHEEASVDNIEFNADYEEAVKQLTIKDALVSVNGGKFRNTRRIAVRPRDVVRFRVILQGLEGVQHQETAKFIVPKRFRRSYLIAESGQYEGGSIDCFTVPEDCYQGGTETKFDRLLAKLVNAPKNNDLVMSLRSGRNSDRVITKQEQVVRGFEYIRLTRKDGEGGEESVAGKA
jgi:hypothetical protein